MEATTSTGRDGFSEGPDALPVHKKGLTKRQIVTSIFFRVLFPLILSLICWFSENLTGCLLLLFVFVHPFIPTPGSPLLKKSTSWYLRSVAGFSTLKFCLDFGLLVTVYVSDNVRAQLSCGSEVGKILRQFGFVNLHGHDWKNVLAHLGTECILLVISLMSLILHQFCRNKPTKMYLRADKKRRQIILEKRQRVDEATRLRIQIILSPVMEGFGILLMICSACCVPSIPSFIYLIWYLTGGALWALHANVFRWYYKYSWVLLAVCTLNLFALSLFQGELMRDLVPPDNIWLRLFGIIQLVTYECVSHPTTSGIPDEFMQTQISENLTYSQYINHFFVFTLYYLLAYGYSFYWKCSKQHDSLGGLDIFGKRRDKASNAIRNSTMFKEGSILNWLLIKTKVTKAMEMAWNQIENNFYLFSVSFMIFWSIFCHGFITLTLLFTAIYLWTRSKSNTRTKKTAPFLVIYCTLYIIVQHIFNFDLKPDEFVQKEYEIVIADHPMVITWADIRLTSTSMSMLIYLGSQCLFIIIFWILLRYFMSDYLEERKQRAKNADNPSTSRPVSVDDIMTEEEERKARELFQSKGRRKTFAAISATLSGNKRRLKEIASACWMTLCILTLMLVCTIQVPDYFRIGYMVFYLCFLIYTVIKLSVKTSRNSVPNFELFLRFILFYSLLVLLFLYVYQFSFWKGGEIDGQLQPKLSIILPIAFLLVVMKIQFDYFHGPFNDFMGHFSASSNIALESLDYRKNSLLKAIQKDSMAKKMSKIVSQCIELVWLVVRIHIDKLFLLVLMGVIVQATSSIHFLFLVIFIFLCFTKHKFWFLAQLAAIFLSCFTILSRMIYILYISNGHKYDEQLQNCTNPSNFPWTQNFPRWIGIYEGEDPNEASIFYLWPQLCLVNTFFFATLIKQRMKSRLDKIDRRRNHCEHRSDIFRFEYYKKKSLNLIFSIRSRILFPNITRAHADKGFKNMTLYLINYWFYKFGLEFVIIYVVTMVGDVCDFYSMFYIILLIPVMVCRRQKLYLFARILSIFTSSVLILKFLFLLWVPPLELFCDYNFFDWMKDSRNREQFMATKLFFFLPDFYDPKVYNLQAKDLVPELLLMTVLRSFLYNLQKEKTDERIQQHGGNNFDCLDEPDRTFSGNQHQIKHRTLYQRTNFTSEQKQPMNVLKKIIFMHGIWITYFILGLRGLRCFDILGFPYIGFAIYLLWMGQEIALKTRKRILRKLNLIIIYVSVSMVIRIFMQVDGFFCNSVELQDAWAKLDYIINTFEINILSKYYLFPVSSGDISKHCANLFYDSSGILKWEMVCLIILTIQKRIFMSHYYDFVMEEIATTMEMSKQGGILIQKFNKLDIAKAIATRERITKDLENAIARIRQRMLSMDDWYEPVDHLDSIFNGDRFFNQSYDPDQDIQSLGGDKSGDITSQVSVEKDSENIGIDDCDMKQVWMNYRTEIKKITFERCFPGKTEEVQPIEILEPQEVETLNGETENEEKSQEKQEDSKKEEKLQEEVDDFNDNPSTSQEKSTKTANINFLEVSDDPEMEDFSEDESITTEDSINTKPEMESQDGSNNQNDTDISLIKGTIGKVDKLLALMKFGMFTVLGHIAEIFDSASAAFRRVIVRLAELRKRRKTFLQDEHLISESSENLDTSGKSGRRSQSIEQSLAINSLDDTVQNISETQFGSLALLIESDDIWDVNPEETEPESEPKPETDPGSCEEINREAQNSQPISTAEPKLHDGKHETMKHRYSIYVLFIRDFWLSFYYFLISQTDHVSYFLIGFVVTLDGSLLEMALAVLCLVWGLLSKPRPTKRFWSCCTSLTALIIISKWIFETQLFTYNQEPVSDPPYALEVIVGSLGSQTPLIYAWLLLVFLCFHRNILLSFGLWTNYESNQKEQAAYNRQSYQADLITSVSCHASNFKANTNSVSFENRSLPKNDSFISSINDESAYFASTKTLDSSFGTEFDISSDRSKIEKLKTLVVDCGKEIKMFYKELIDSNKTATKDVYVFMFAADLIGYVIVTVGYAGFSDTDGKSVIGSVIFDNEVPSFYLGIILIMFIFSLLDRLAYLTKNVTLKLVHYVTQVILVHFWLILISPSIFGVSHKFSNNKSAKIFYFFRWTYWLLSAYQIKCSFPVRVLGNCFSKKYNKVCKFSMMAFTKIPFLFELRVIMDWIFTPTTLKFSRWLEVEDAFVTTFIIKCNRCGEKLDRRRRGELQPVFPAKFIYFAIFFGMIIVIWAPILMFSILNKTKVSTEISVADIDIKFGVYQSVFQRSNLGVIPQNLVELQGVADRYGYILSADSKNYDASKVSFGRTSEQVWTITPPARQQLSLDLEKCNDMQIQIEVRINRKASANETSVNIQNVISGIFITDMSKEICNKLSTLIENPRGHSLIHQNGSSATSESQNSVVLPHVLPMFLEMNSNGELVFINSKNLPNRSDVYNWMSLRASIEKDHQYPQIIQWWSVSNQNDGGTFSIYIVTTKVFPSIFSSIASYGIVGLYITFVLVVSTQLKSALGGAAAKIWLNEMPDVSHIQKIIKEMYMCREMKHFTLEEDLYSQLQYLYRSSETLIANTKYKKD